MEYTIRDTYNPNKSKGLHIEGICIVDQKQWRNETEHRSITSKKKRIMNLWNDRQLARTKSWYNLVQ